MLLLLNSRGDNLISYCSEQRTQMCLLMIALYLVARARSHTQPLKGGKLSSRLVIISFTLVLEDRIQNEIEERRHITLLSKLLIGRK